MIKLLFIISATTILFFQESQTLSGRWKLIQYKNLITGEIENAPPNIHRSVIFECKDDSHSGRLEGHTIMNTIGGNYTIEEDNRISFANLGGTKIGEPEWGHKFVSAFYHSSGYTVSKDTLTILYDGSTKAVVFIKADAAEK